MIIRYVAYLPDHSIRINVGLKDLRATFIPSEAKDVRWFCVTCTNPTPTAWEELNVSPIHSNGAGTAYGNESVLKAVAEAVLERIYPAHPESSTPVHAASSMHLEAHP